MKSSLLFLLFLILAGCSVESTSSYYQDWPLPRMRHISRQMRHRRSRPPYPSYALHQQQSLQETQSIWTDVYSFFGECFISHDQLPNLPEPGIDAELKEPTESQKTCEICLQVVELDECFCCCTNRHNIHLPCLTDWIFAPSSTNLKTCPLCREPLINDPEQLRVLIIQTNPESDPIKWEIIACHVKVFKRAKPVDMKGRDWFSAFSLILSKGTPAHFRAFLEFDLIDLQKYGGGAVACLIHGINCHQNEPRRVERLKGNLQILLEHPRIELNRYVDDVHLIYRAINANLFPVFLQILQASPQLDLAVVFRYVCALPKRDLIFNYLFTCKMFDIFEPDEFNCSALHIAVSKGLTEYALLLLNSPQLTLDHLMLRDRRTGRTVLHTVMFSIHDDKFIERITSAFTGIDWDIKDYSGTSIAQLYENRSL